MVKIHKKKYIEQDVFEKAKERVRYLYNQYEDVVVSFSGGKDSTALLLVCLDVAKELNRLPVNAFFYDEEAIHPPTIEYVQRVANMEDVNLDWYCLPIKHRNACSNEQPFWQCWDPALKDLWVREMPKQAITSHKRFVNGQSMQEFGIKHYQYTNKVVVQGIRTEESLRRYRVVAMKKNENFISKPEAGVFFAYPIYDMSSVDVWRVVDIKNADYNKTYDIFNKTNQYNQLLRQRVCPPYGEEPLRGLYIYAECFPEMWHKMINRVPGAATAARYGNTELYSSGIAKPENITWREHTQNVLDTFSGEHKNFVAKNINTLISRHKNLTNDAIPEKQYHPLSGISWEFIVKSVTRGDFKGRIKQVASKNSQDTLKKLNITLEEAKVKYGK
jgi:predicted phosphoadenosine phosphosulfate sulfurtransferase